MSLMRLTNYHVVNTEHAVKGNQREQAYYYNRGAKDLRPLQEGEQVTEHSGHQQM